MFFLKDVFTTLKDVLPKNKQKNNIEFLKCTFPDTSSNNGLVTPCTKLIEILVTLNSDFSDLFCRGLS